MHLALPLPQTSTQARSCSLLCVCDMVITVFSPVTALEFARNGGLQVLWRLQTLRRLQDGKPTTSSHQDAVLREGLEQKGAALISTIAAAAAAAAA